MTKCGSTVLAVATLLMAAMGSAPAGAKVLTPSAQRGLTYVRLHCSQCHAVGKVGSSPLKVAPPFRTLHERYPVESLEEALGEGIVTGHPTMPEFQLDPGQVRDVVTYLKSLED